MAVWFEDVGDTAGHVPYSGRRVMVTDVKVVTEANVAQLVADAIALHEENRKEIAYLMQYIRNVQPVRNRKKEVRPEINYKVVVNEAASIVNFKVGYEFGNPPVLVQRADKDSGGDTPDVDDSRICLLNEYLHEQGKAGKDEALARDFCTTGVGYRMALARRKEDTDRSSPFDIIPLSPLTTMVIYSADVYHDPVIAISYTVIGGPVLGNTTSQKLCGAYTKDKYFVVKDGVLQKHLTTDNGIGMIPIIEYRCDRERMGAFERVLPLLDCLNDQTSDRQNAIAQFVQSLLVFLNCEVDPDELSKMGSQGAIAVGSGNAKVQANVKLLESVLDQAGAQTFTDFLMTQIENIAGVPGRNADAQNTTGEAVMLSSGWQLAETAAKSAELVYEESEMQLLRVILRIIALDPDADSELKSLKLSDIDIKFSRNRTDGLLTKVQALQLLFQAGVRNKHALEAAGLWSDVETVWNDSKDTILAAAEVKSSDQSTSPKVEPVGEGHTEPAGGQNPKDTAGGAGGTDD